METKKTNKAKKKDKRKRIEEIIKVAVWNPRGITNKETELEKELKERNVDIAVIPETKKKQKGTSELEHYILLYSGVTLEERAAAGIAILIKREWKDRIHSYQFIDKRIIKIRFRTHRGYTSLIGIYSPEEGRPNDAQEFYENLQTITNSINTNDYIIIAGDFNARIGNIPIENIMDKHGEPVVNNNGKLLIDFATYNNFKVTNTFFPHKEIHKFTWSDRGRRSIIDYVLTNQKLSKLVQDTRVYRGSDIGSDHFLLISSIAPLQKQKISR